MVEQVVVGIDVSKAKLDVALLPGGEQLTVSNDRHGIGELLRRLSRLAPNRVVLEATGKLEQLAVSELAAGSSNQPRSGQALRQGTWQMGQDRSDRCAADCRVRS